MRSFFLATLFVGALASPARNQPEQVLSEKNNFCDGAQASMGKEPKAAAAYCSAYLNIPIITVKKTLSRITKTITETTSTRTYLAYPVTTMVAKTITHPSTVQGTITRTITTSISTETYTNPLTTCPVARQNCKKKRDANPPPLFDSRPSCLSTYNSPWTVSKACKCLSLSTSTITKLITPPSAPTVSTTTILAAGKTTRTLTRTITTSTHTFTPTYGPTVTVSVAATATLDLVGPFKLASAPDYAINPPNGWAYVNPNNMIPPDVPAEFGGESDCKSTYFTLNGTQLLTQYFDKSSANFPAYNLIANAKVTAGQGANPIYFTHLKSEVLGERRRLSCTFGTDDEKGANVHAACPLRCTYHGGSSRNTRREGEGNGWYLGDEDEEFESFTMYAYKYGGETT